MLTDIKRSEGVFGVSDYLKSNKLIWTDTPRNRKIKEWLDEKGEVIGVNNFIKLILEKEMEKECNVEKTEEAPVTGFDF